jgi:membrane protease YdiL (CAAX protease family)
LFDHGNDNVWLFNIVAFDIALVALGILTLRVDANEIKIIIGRRPLRKDIYWLVALGASFFAMEPGLQGLLALWANNFAPQMANATWSFWAPVNMRRQDPVQIIVYGLILTVIVPIAEEFVFRGLFLRPKLASTRFHFYAVGTSIFFTLLHFEKPEWISTFVFSIGMAYLYRRSQSLVACIAVHGLCNLLTFVQYYFAAQLFARPRMEAHLIQTWWVEVCFVLLSSACIGAWAFSGRGPELKTD